MPSAHEDRFVFDIGPPDVASVLAEATRRLAGEGGIEQLYLDGNAMIARSTPGPFARSVVCAVMAELGGRHVDKKGHPDTFPIPSWAHQPITDLSWAERVRIRYRWWRSRNAAAPA